MTTTFVLEEPSLMAGTPYEVAYRSLSQASATVGLAINAVSSAIPLIRNAEMSRQCDMGQDIDLTAWEQGAYLRKLHSVIERLSNCRDELETLAAATSYDPCRPH